MTPAVGASGKRRTIVFALGLVSLLVALGCGPTVIFAGGRLSGDVKPVPRDWTHAQAIPVVQLETRPEHPYSVNLWGVEADGVFYVMGANDERTWVQHLREDPLVRLKVCDDVYEMRATVVNDEGRIDAVLEALSEKYDGFRPTEAERAEGVLVALEAR